MSNSFLYWKEVAFPRKWHCDKKPRMSKATKSIFPLIVDFAKVTNIFCELWSDFKGELMSKCAKRLMSSWEDRENDVGDGQNA